MLDVLLEFAGEAILTVAGPTAKSVLARRRRARASDLPRWNGIVPSGPAKNAVLDAIQKLQVSEAEAESIAAFVESGEGALLIRYIAVDVLTGRDAKVDVALAEQATALMTLCPTCQISRPERLAPQVVHLMMRAVQVALAELRAVDPDYAKELRQLAIGERQAHLLADLSPNSRALWDVTAHQPDSLVKELAAYCSDLAAMTATLSVPSIQEERRVPLRALYIEPEIDRQVTAAVAEETALSRVLSERSMLVVLGDPGGGKSTLVKATVHQLATDAAASGYAAVPILVPLARYWNAQTADRSLGLIDFAAQEIRSQGAANLDAKALRYLLATGRLVMFFDGFDEVLDVPTRIDIRDRIETLSRRYRGCSVVVTSRQTGYYEAPLDGTDFLQLKIGSMTVEKVQRFAATFFKLSVADDREWSEMVHRFMDETNRAADLRRNPLMLGLLCLLYESGRSIPRNQADLFRDCALLLFSRWDSRRGIHTEIADAETAENAIAAIALSIFDSSGDEVSDSWLRFELQDFYRREASDDGRAAARFARDVLDLWRGRKWLLVTTGHRDGEEWFRFSHRTFLEYFAATQLAYECGTAAELWNRIRPLVITRSAVVYCLLAAQLHSRSKRGAGEAMLAVLDAEMKISDQWAGWNISAFASELLLAIRADSAAKAECCTEIVSIIQELIPIKDTYPEDGDVYAEVLGGDSDRTGDAEVVYDEDDYDNEAEHDYGLNFGQATLPLMSLARGADEPRDLMLRQIGEILHDRLADQQADRARVLKLCLELPQFVYLEGWQGLSKSQKEAFASWAVTVRDAALSNDSNWRGVTGRDFWLDVYLARSGVSSLPEFIGNWSGAGALLGGWGLALVSPPPAGTVLHRIATVVAHHLAPADLAADELLTSARPMLRDVLTGADGLYDDELFEKLPEFEASVFPSDARLDIARLSDEARAGLIYLLAVLAMMGERRAPDWFAKAADDWSGKSLATAAAVIVYPGYAAETAEAVYNCIGDRAVQLEVLSALNLCVEGVLDPLTEVMDSDELAAGD